MVTSNRFSNVLLNVLIRSRLDKRAATVVATLVPYRVGRSAVEGWRRHGAQSAVRGYSQGFRATILCSIRWPSPEAAARQHVQREWFPPRLPTLDLTSISSGRCHNWLLYSLLLQVETSFMTFEGQALQGSVKIMEKLNVSKYRSISRIGFNTKSSKF